MMSEGSTPPKERINVKIIPRTAGKPERELPLNLLMVGDYTGSPDERPLEERKPVEVDKTSFNGVMEQHNLAVTMEDVPDRLTDEKDATMSVTLRFKTLRDFEPSSIMKQ